MDRVELTSSSGWRGGTRHTVGTRTGLRTFASAPRRPNQEHLPDRHVSLAALRVPHSKQADLQRVTGRVATQRRAHAALSRLYT